MHKQRSLILGWLMSVTLLSSLLLAMTPMCFGTRAVLAETPPSLDWSQTFGDIFDEGGYSVQRTSGGGYVVAGYYGDTISNYDAWLIKTDESGNKQWEMMFGDIYNDYAYSVQQTADGGYVMVGQTYSYGNGGSDVWLIKTDATGTKQWDRTFGGSMWDEGRSVQQTADGGYVVVGYTFSHGAGGSDLWLIKTDASGVMEWGRTFGGSSGDVGFCVQQTADGGYVVAGGTHSYGAGYYDAWLIKIDASGNWQWGKTFGGPADDYAYSLQQTTDGGFVMAGWTYSYGAGYGDFYLVKTDGSGNFQWQRIFGGSEHDWAHSVQQTANGGYVLAGFTESYGAGGLDVWLVETDSSGNRQWDKTFGASDDDEGYSVVQATDGGYVVAGRTISYGAGSRDLWLVKTTDCTAPPAPALLSPANETEINDSTPLLGWSDVTDPSGIANYWVQVDSYSHFPSPVVNLPVTSSEYTVPSALPDGLYYWRVYARDEANNYSSPSAVWSFTVDTGAPLEVATATAAGVGSTVATLNGYLTGLGTASSVEVSFEWGQTAGYGSATTPLTVTYPCDFSFPLEGLTPETTYHFRAKAEGDSTVYGDDMTFTTDAAATTPPEVATAAAAGMGSTVATLNGNLSSLGTAATVEVSFQWGLTAGYGTTTTPLTVSDPCDFSFPLEGLPPGATYHFRAKAVGDGTVYGDDMTFTTDVADTSPPEVATAVAAGIGSTVATLNGYLTSLGTAATAVVSFEWGLTAGYGTTTTPLTVSDPCDFSFPLEGLTPETSYHFRAKAVGEGTVYGDDMTFTTDAAGVSPPAVATVAATGTGSTVATLNGSLEGLGTAATVEVSFEWGLTAGYGSATAPQGVTEPCEFNFPLEELTPGATYHFRAKAEGDGTVYGDDMTFTTEATDTSLPEVATAVAAGIGSTVATLNGYITGLGAAPSVEVSFEWGLTAGYGSATTPQSVTEPCDFSFHLEELTPETTYHFRAKAVGEGTVYGDDMTFTTDVAATTPPEVDTAAASGLGSTVATLNGVLSGLGSASSVEVSFEWGLTSSYGNPTTALVVTDPSEFDFPLDGLTPGTSYHFRAKAVGDGAVYGDDMSFTTEAGTTDTTAPVASAVEASGTTASGTTITWTTDEPATSQVEYGLTAEYGSSTPLDTELVTGHSVELSGLKAGLTYHYRVISRDASDNEVVSPDFTFETPGGSGGTPVWIWVLIGLAVTVVAGAAAFLIRGRLAKR